MIYILNPGDLKDVRTFSDRLVSENELIEAREKDRGARLYSFDESRKRWRIYDTVYNRWFDIDISLGEVPIKVLNAAGR